MVRRPIIRLFPDFVERIKIKKEPGGFDEMSAEKKTRAVADRGRAAGDNKKPPAAMRRVGPQSAASFKNRIFPRAIIM